MKLTHPYLNLTGGEWLKGNLHAHTTRSDGHDEPQTVIEAYAGLGHDFLMLSDHEVLTTATQYRQWKRHGLILIPGVEIAGGPHLLHVDGPCAISPAQPRQQILNRIGRLAETRGRGFAIVNHPSWGADFNHASITQLREWVGYAGIEIFNGVIHRHNGSPYALDKWDMLLGMGRQVWGFANDDSHAGASDCGLGWNVAYVHKRSVRGVVEALREGRFYASTGVTIRSIQVAGTRVRVEADQAECIAAYRDVGRRFATVDRDWIEVEAPADARYIRFECWGRGETRAWTQPFFVQ